MRQTLGLTRAYIQEKQLLYTLPELEEWNFSVSQRELINGTAYKVVFIAKNVLECWDKSADFAYWGFSDDLGETRPPTIRSVAGRSCLPAASGSDFAFSFSRFVSAFFQIDSRNGFFPICRSMRLFVDSQNASLKRPEKTLLRGIFNLQSCFLPIFSIADIGNSKTSLTGSNHH